MCIAKRKTYLAWATGIITGDPPSSKTGLSMEYEDVGGGDFDFFMLVNLRIKLTLPLSFFSLLYKMKEYRKLKSLIVENK